jgi:CMP-N-acetylneuraminic acid synthetase
MNQEILAIIPARGSHDEVDHMNVRTLGGKPLIYYTIRAAQQSKKISRIIVSTDDEKIKDISIKFGAEVPFFRPKNLSKDTHSIKDVILHVLDTLYRSEGYSCDRVVVLLPNTPFKSPDDIDQMIEKLNSNCLDSVIPLCRKTELFWKIINGNIIPINFTIRGTRSEADPVFEEKGGIYTYHIRDINQLDDALKLGEKVGYHHIDQHNAQTIHTMYEFFIFERLIKLPNQLIKEIMKAED